MPDGVMLHQRKRNNQRHKAPMVIRDTVVQLGPFDRVKPGLKMSRKMIQHSDMPAYRRLDSQRVHEYCAIPLQQLVRLEPVGLSHQAAQSLVVGAAMREKRVLVRPWNSIIMSVVTDPRSSVRHR